MVERQLPKLNVVGSIPITRSKLPLSKLSCLVGLAAFVLPTAASAAPTCSEAQTRALLAPASHPDEAVALDCSPMLGPTTRITKRIVLAGRAADGVVIDCGGGRIGRAEAQPSFPNPSVEIRSRKVSADPARPVWERPSGIVIRNCRIDGPIRIWGLGINGQAEDVRLSSLSLGHTERAQAAAPTRIRIEDSELTAHGGTPLYVGPGVTEAALVNSTIRGTAPAIAVYLDAESARNTIAGNRFDIATGREVIAVDGSARNTIADNRFRIAWRGGIYLYRNCGEGGTVRHQTPSHNTIAGNRFAYSSPIHLPSISVGSREGWSRFCDEDKGYPFGSSIDDGDHASENIVSGNVVE